MHFDRARDAAFEIGAQAAVQNLSDLAASGGAAGWCVWSLALDWPPAELHALTRGFMAVAAPLGARLVGGNLSRAPAGAAVITVTVGGSLAGDRVWRRADARIGHRVYLSGPLGDAAVGVIDPSAEARAARHRWRPHLPEAAALAAWGGIGGAMDVSDGLLLDAARMARAAGLALALDPAAIPLGPSYRARQGTDPALAMRGGEDYVLLFTAAERPPLGVEIGRCVAGEGVWLDGAKVAAAGWDHFGVPR